MGKIMSLLLAEKYYTPTHPRTHLHHLTALLRYPGDWDHLHHAVTENIEKLCHRAPFAYLIANEKLVDLREKWQHWTEGPYYQALESRQLKRGGWFGAPTFPEPVETVIMSAGRRDIHDYVGQIYDDWHQIMCLPALVSLEAIDEVVYNSASTSDAILKLLAQGGFIVSCIDFRVFEIFTMDASYKEIFSDDSP